jgi:hypothetical protein
LEDGAMPYRWPTDTDFAPWELDVLDRSCSVCGRRMYLCDHRDRHLHTREGPVESVCKLNHGPDPHCPGPAKTKSPEIEATIAPPHWAIGWDVFCWIGHRRCSRHWAIPPIRAELRDAYRIALSDDAIGQDIHRYQVPLAARQPDPVARLRQCPSVDEIILAIDGLQPEKGHATLQVVRELTQKRARFAEALISATADEVRRPIAQAKRWAEAPGKPVGLWLSDRPDAFVTGIAAESPGGPPRYCRNHSLRDVAQPMSEIDSHAQVQMRQEVRGLRTIDQAALKRPGAAAPEDAAGTGTGSTSTGAVEPADPAAPQADAAGAVVLDSGAAARGILHDDPGGPLHPPGLRMAEALDEVRESIQRDPDEKKGGSPSRNSAAGPAASTGASTQFGPNKRRSATPSRTSRQSRRPSIQGGGPAPTAGRGSRSRSIGSSGARIRSVRRWPGS